MSKIKAHGDKRGSEWAKAKGRLRAKIKRRRRMWDIELVWILLASPQ